ncbi:Cytochrome c4 precursor [Roseovarius litorisediminis]|uniref:Cytochrome c4 n=1 Tax=Roseovarius litorisediminis TaxID=1312363 RepID=A0A1Y5RDG6_9RHOB|nr:cytochrome c [Roseovarius litorisediminis]SLN12177.1 Cytochrome c4 precursor [Roseovarius litorisediminis]
MKQIIITALGGVFLAGVTFAQEVLNGDPEQGRQISGQCRTCHGVDGFAKIPIAPHIGGEPAPYLASQLTAFRDGTREHEMMSVVAKGLTDSQIADLAAWYSAQQATATLAPGVIAAFAPEGCTGCHGEDGMGRAEDVPNLAGESNIYIETQLKAFRSGKRKHEIMSDIAADLSDSDIRAVAKWYGNVKLTIKMTE